MTTPLNICSVLIVDGVNDACENVLRAHGVKVKTKKKITKPELLEEIKYHGALVVRSETQVTPDIITAGPHLKVICRAGAGCDNIDFATAGMHGVGVINTPGANSISACELTCTLMLTISRHIVPAVTTLKNAVWSRPQFTGNEVYGKTLGIIGLGRVGREVARRMHAFGMKIVGYDPIVSGSQALEFNVTKVTLEEIWPVADYITLHTPLMDATRNFIDARVLPRCKKGVYLINVGRGGLINEVDLYNALESGQVGGAALDVFEMEPATENPASLRLIQHPRVIATPHLGASTKEAQIRVAKEIGEQLVNLIKPDTYPDTPLSEVTYQVLQK